MRARPCELATLAILACASGAGGQENRAELIQEARVTGDEAARRDLFMRAADPTQPDSLWAVSVYEIAQIMRDLGQDSVAATWIRWVDRHGDWPIDAAYFAPSLVAFVDGLADGAPQQPGPDSGTAATDWEWPAAFAGTGEGTVEVASAQPGVSLNVTVAGQDVALQQGGRAALPSGTYTLVASAAEHETMQVTREVLPGVGTLVSFDLVPILADDVSEQVSGSVLLLRDPVAAVGVCRNGVSVRDGFVVASLSGLEGATQVEVLREGQPPLGGSVVGTDPDGDLAVLTVEGLGAPALAAADDPAGPSFAWSVYRSGCDAPVGVFRTRLGDGGQALTPLPQAALGSPLVDRGGSLLGLVTASGVVSPIERVGDLVDAAARQLDRGGFPTVWVAVGAAAVGGVAALLLGGGGGGGGNGADTGSIIVTLPSG